ncbi:MAG: FAD-dependent oxidoreductase [Firmicutes bacterium]|nr:FAD-dependent oxidoreductase [Bacillota bacterium]MCL1953856.1 FAD-dependent oxidoreductase [Bacillota bacterium]
MNNHYDIIIIGGGPGGLTAAIYAARASKKVLVIENSILGGVMASTERVDNFPGFITSTGMDLALKMEEQALASGAKIEYATVSKLDCDKKTIELDDGTVLTANFIIVATGAGSKKLGIGREDELTGSGISYCATCDGAFFKDMPVAIVGGTVHTTTDAIYLEPIVSELTIIVPIDKMRGLPDQIKLLQNSPKVKIIYNARVTSVGTTKKGMRDVVNSFLAVDNNGKEYKSDIQSLFVALGTMPNSHLVFGQVDTDKSGAIITDNKMRTNKDGIFAIGDVRADSIKQIVISCSDGATAVCTILGSVVYSKK